MSSATSRALGLDGTLGLYPSVAAGDLTSLSDVDYYSVTGLSIGSFSVSFRTSGISMLKARLTLLNSSGQVVASTAATDPANGDLTLTANQLLSLGTYYVKVEKAASDVFGIGAYRLAIGRSANQATSDPVIAGLLAKDLHSNDSATSATQLVRNSSQDLRWDYTLRAILSDSWDADWYRVHSPATNPGTMVVAVWGTNFGGVDPVISVLDKNRMPVSVQVLTNDDGTLRFSCQMLSPTKTTTSA